MARNIGNSSRIQRQVPEHRPAQRRDRRRLMVQIVATFLVLAMLLPVLVAFL